MTSEFSCIKEIITKLQVKREDTLIHAGDDCALVTISPGMALAVSTDTMVVNHHFLPDCDPQDIGYKLVAVNLSDLAAMAAKPAWMTIALTMPEIDMEWVRKFILGANELQQQFNLELVGGDLTRGPLTITCTIHGLVKPEDAITRGGARRGDLICVTGRLGAAAYALANLDCSVASRQRLLRPTPRVNEALAIHSMVNSAIDISDGLLADLNHIIEASGCGAVLDASTVPLAEELEAIPKLEEALPFALSGGDDYELCMTLDKKNFSACQHILMQMNCELHCIGKITDGDKIEVYLNNQLINFSKFGYQHFA